ncbi:MAG: DUF3352 domain-containing protein [Nostocaceae cyanobacterium]|nr:DUF3352 domain-containing protein [Nostocaceae cyanobacterium]
MLETKSKFLIPILGVGVIVAGSIAAYMYFKAGPSGSADGVVASAKIVPDEALMATYITTNPQAWAKLQQFGTPQAQKLVSQGLEDLVSKRLQYFTKNTFKNGNISYEQDLKPWIGGVTIAMLPSNSIPEAQSQGSKSAATQKPNILMVVGIKDKLSALNFAKKLKSQKGVTSKEIDYKGENIVETTTKGKSTYSAVLNNTHIVVAPEKSAVVQAIDTFKGEPSFASKKGFSSLLAGDIKLENTVAQVYVPDYAAMMEQLDLSRNDISTQIAQSFYILFQRSLLLGNKNPAQLKEIKSMVARVGVDDAGVRMKAIANLDPQLNKYEYKNTSGKIISKFPADTLAVVTGEGISRLWSKTVEQSKDDPQLNQIVKQARTQVKQTVNLDLDKEVFGWMDGEYGFAAIPTNQGLLGQFGLGGVFVLNTSDRKTAEATFTKLDTIAKKQYRQFLKIDQTKIGDQKVTEWQIPGQGTLISRGWLDQDTMFVGIGSVAEAIVTPKGQSLAESKNFKAVTSSLPQPNNGYFYLDMDKNMTIVNKSAGLTQPPPPEYITVLSSIRGVGMAATNPDKSTSEIEMLLALKKNTGN